jgi:hypothetical protein
MDPIEVGMLARNPEGSHHRGVSKTQISIRLEDDLLERVKEYAEELRERTPGVGITTVDALRSLIILGLQKAGEDAKPTKRRS